MSRRDTSEEDPSEEEAHESVNQPRGDVGEGPSRRRHSAHRSFPPGCGREDSPRRSLSRRLSDSVSDELDDGRRRIQDMEQTMIQAVREAQEYRRQLDEAHEATQRLRTELAEQRRLREQAEEALETLHANLNVTEQHRRQMERAHTRETRETLAHLEETIAGYDAASQQASARIREMHDFLRRSPFSGHLPPE